MSKNLEYISFSTMLRQMPVIWSVPVVYLLSALGGYVVVYGPLAIVGMWRASFLSPVQIAIFVIMGMLFNLTALMFRTKGLKAGVVWGVVFLVLAVLYVVGSLGPNDFPDAIILPLIPLAFGVCNGVFYDRLMSLVGDSPKK